MRRLTTLAMMFAVLGGAAGCGSSKPSAPPSAATTTASVQSPLSRCVQEWNANTSSPSGHEIAQAAAREGHRNGYMFVFSGGQCGLQIGGLEVWADIGSTGHFEPWLGNVNGTPEVSTALREALAHRVESQPNVALEDDGSVSALPGAQISQISQPVDVPKGGFEPGTSGPANTEPYNINESAWNQLSVERQLDLLVQFASHGGCSVQAARAIANAVRNGVFKIEENDVSNTLTHACANPESIPRSTTKAREEPSGSTSGATASGNCGRIPPYISDINASGMTCADALEFANRVAFKAPSCWPRAQMGASAACEFEGHHCESLVAANHGVAENHADIVCTTPDSQVSFSVVDTNGHVHAAPLAPSGTPATEPSVEKPFVAEKGNGTTGGVECAFSHVIANGQATSEPSVLCASPGAGAVTLLPEGQATTSSLGNPLTYSFQTLRVLRTGRSLADGSLVCTALSRESIRCESLASHHEFVVEGKGWSRK
jgi:hypothetical protein